MQRVIVLFSLLLLMGAAPGTRPDIRQVDFKNFTYRIENCYDKPIKARAGKFSGRMVHEFASGRSVESISFEVIGVSYGDLNRDGQPEAVIKVFCENGGNHGYSAGLIYTMAKGKPKLLHRFDYFLDGNSGHIKTIAIENGFLKVESDSYAPMDGRCCPSLVSFTIYRLTSDNILKQVVPTVRSVRPGETFQDRRQSIPAFLWREEPGGTLTFGQYINTKDCEKAAEKEIMDMLKRNPAFVRTADGYIDPANSENNAHFRCMDEPAGSLDDAGLRVDFFLPAGNWTIDPLSVTPFFKVRAWDLRLKKFVSVDRVHWSLFNSPDRGYWLDVESVYPYELRRCESDQREVHRFGSDACSIEIAVHTGRDFHATVWLDR